jgi:hypothetical protein
MWRSVARNCDSLRRSLKRAGVCCGFEAALRGGEMGGAYSMHWRVRKCPQNVSHEPRREDVCSETYSGWGEYNIKVA